MSFLSVYLETVNKKGNQGLSEAIAKTVADIVPRYISNFSYSEQVVSLLVGDVQSGKTSHVLGLASAAADQGFGIFILLTTDNILLQQQTFQRAKNDLTEFCVCSEDEYMKFADNAMKKPVLVVLKKNTSILRQWKNNFASTSFCVGNPLFIIDDEGDAASLNTKVNKQQQSRINAHLTAIKSTSSSSIYLQVTGTPQSILLQSIKSNWKPYFIYYFEPGSGYLGGNFFFPDEMPTQVVLTDNLEARELLADDEFPENGLKVALISHLLVSEQLFVEGKTVCNFLIHPSVKISEHQKFAEKVGLYLNEIFHSYEECETEDAFKKVYEDLKETKKEIEPFEKLYQNVIERLQRQAVNILVLNSLAEYSGSSAYSEGLNVIVGGNSLGRGVTFPQLQTIYYCRVAKNPQADTMWQHARMFGYDRDAALMRVFMPPKLYKIFFEINLTNNSIINQIKKQNEDTAIKFAYPKMIKPTRKNVLDKKAVGLYAGGVNYFPFEPINNGIEDLDLLLERFQDEVYPVSLKFILKVFSHLASGGEDWNAKVFAAFVESLVAQDALSQGRLIVRRNRAISKGTGTLLSPTDRKLGERFQDEVVLTLYKVTGDKGWGGEKLWVPNIKLPGNMIYYSGE